MLTKLKSLWLLLTKGRLCIHCFVRRTGSWRDELCEPCFDTQEATQLAAFIKAILTMKDDGNKS